MTTIVLTHPTEQLPRFQVFVLYETTNIYHAFDAKEFDNRRDAQRAAHQMMKTYEADHFRRVIEVEQPSDRNC